MHQNLSQLGIVTRLQKHLLVWWFSVPHVVFLLQSPPLLVPIGFQVLILLTLLINASHH